jgi:hypothetical protein
MAPGLSAEHANQTGLVRRVSLSSAGPFAGHFTVRVPEIVAPAPDLGFVHPD